MGKDKKPVVTRNFLKQLSRGLVKSIPVYGAFLEQVIYGTLDGEGHFLFLLLYISFLLSAALLHGIGIRS